MFIKLTCLIIIATTVLAKDELLASLAGEHGRNRLTLCMDNATKCEGVLWKTQWAIARASCVADKPLYKMAVIKSAKDADCREYITELVLQRARKVEVMFNHPSYTQSPAPNNDLALALLWIKYPYSIVESLADTDVAEHMLQEFEPWMENIVRSYQRDEGYVSAYDRKSGVFVSPMKTFVAMVVVPSAMFIAFFFFITCYTKAKSKPPLGQCHYEKL